jgi:hypothetical protein
MRAYTTSDALQWLSSTAEGDLYDIGGGGRTEQLSKRERRAAARNAVLLLIVHIASPVESLSVINKNLMNPYLEICCLHQHLYSQQIRTAITSRAS